ncbi:MAG: TRAFs-binding domain-containing protein [Bacteroidota bacterium]
MKPLCFVLMPFGIKTDSLGRQVDFNHIYEALIKKAIEKCDLEPIRADEELLGGTIHKPMYERLVLCDYAIADLTSLNANVFYELGLRHAIKAHTTIPIFAFDADLPFDLKMQRTLPYKLDKQGKLEDVDATIEMLVSHLNATKGQGNVDSPVFQLIDGWKVSHNLSHEKTDAFRAQAVYENDVKDDLFKARNEGEEAVVKIFEELKPINEKSVGVIIDLFISLRGVEAWEQMFACYEEMDAPLKKLKLVQEQLGFAYNRSGNSEEAKRVLESVIEEYGPDPETNGILGRVYKDLYKAAKADNNKLKATGYLSMAIKSYKEGFDADWRDAYPGVNLVTLLELKGDQKSLDEYLPIVQFANKRKMEGTTPDYWDLATEGELNILKRDYETATQKFSEAIALIPPNEVWMLESTLNNLVIIQDARTENKTQDEDLSNLIESFKEYI